MNNRGFGLRQEIITIIIMLILLLIVTIEIRNLYSDLSNDTSSAGRIENKEPEVKKDYYDDIYYYQLESKIKDATIIYISNENVEFTSNIISIDSSELIKKGYLEELKDENGKACTSNSLASKDEVGVVIVDVKLTCSGYSTKK